MWPRGFPLDSISDDESHTYTICNLSEPVIKQGLVSGDPDLDAIFRLTRKHASKNIDISYDDKAKPVTLPKGVFTPYNSQNTMVTYPAFWSLVLPITVSMRVTDIWRSYWAQRLIWLFGGSLTYYPGTTRQIRNAHSYLKDAQEEIDLYTKASDFVSFLSSWSCSHDDFLRCTMQLTKDTADKGFWGERDVVLIQTFLQDLVAVGYKFPAMSPDAPLCKGKQLRGLTCYPLEQPTTSNVVPELAHTALKQRKPLCAELLQEFQDI